MLRPQLLEEILDSSFLCISQSHLLHILQGWGVQRIVAQPAEDDGTEAQLQAIIDAQMQISERKRGEYIVDVLGTLWSRHGAAGIFMGYHVVVIVGPNLIDYKVQEMATNKCLTYRKGWATWGLPHARVHLMGLFFQQ